MKMMMSSTISLIDKKGDQRRIDKGFLKMMIRMVKPTMLSLDTQWREYCRHHILENSASLLMKMMMSSTINDNIYNIMIS